MTSIMSHPKTLSGTVVSIKMNKTVVVEVERLVKHSVYGKYLRRHKRYLAHDEAGKRHEGDKVEIKETRPMSRRKSFVVVIKN
ncbi:MAG TPA: 30S ribosomal protein S17 [Candidatus Paceibacterota bacterium]